MDFSFKKTLLTTFLLLSVVPFPACRSAADIRNEKEIQRLIAYDNERNEKFFKELMGKIWKLEEVQQIEYDLVDARPVFKNQIYTIVFKNDGTFSGQSFCNSYTGQYSTTKYQDKLRDNITFKNIVFTKMECDKPSDEDDFLKALHHPIRYSMYPDVLIIDYDKDGETRALKFVLDTL